MIQNIKINKSEIPYISFGKGEKVFVIIPGLSIKSVLLSQYAIISAFSDFTDQFTVYLFDRIQDIPDGYTINDMANDTHEAMMKLGIDSCNIFGASQGGMIAQCIAINYPDFVQKMVLASTSSHIDSHSRNVISTRIKLAKSHNISQLNQNFMQTVYCESTIKEFGNIILESNADVSEQELNRFIALASPILDFDVQKDLSKIRCKTLVLGSNNDQIFSGESMQNLAKNLNCESYLYDNFGHAVYDEAPDFRPRMLNFLMNQ